MAMGKSLLSGLNRTRKKAMASRSAMPTIRPKAKKPKGRTYVAASQKASIPAKSDDGERIKVKKSAWRGRWHKE